MASDSDSENKNGSKTEEDEVWSTGNHPQNHHHCH